MENNRIENLLLQILENQTSMKLDVSSIKSQVDKNTIILEKMQSDIKILKKFNSNHSF